MHPTLVRRSIAHSHHLNPRILAPKTRIHPPQDIPAMHRRRFPLHISQDCALWLSYEPFRTKQVVTEGLQALYLAFRDIPEAEYKQWAAIYNHAATMAVAKLIERYMLGHRSLATVRNSSIKRSFSDYAVSSELSSASKRVKTCINKENISSYGSKGKAKGIDDEPWRKMQVDKDLNPFTRLDRDYPFDGCGTTSARKETGENRLRIHIHFYWMSKMCVVCYFYLPRYLIYFVFPSGFYRKIG